MIESGYYPPGAEFDPRAPYNQIDEDEEEELERLREEEEEMRYEMWREERLYDYD